MATQRYISTSFWDDEWIMSLDPSEKFIYLYLMTNTLNNIAGVYKLSIRRICFDTGYNEETVKKVLDRFKKSNKVYKWDEYVILPSWPKHQKWETKVKIRDGIISILQDLPKALITYLDEIDYKFDLSQIDSRIISSKERRGISGTTKKKLYTENNNECSICGSVEDLVIHHKKSIKDGGDNSYANLQLVCSACHSIIHSPDMVSRLGVQSGYEPNYLDSDIDIDIDPNTDTDIESPPQSLSVLITEIIKHWNTKINLPRCRYTAATLPMLSEVATKFDMYSIDEVKQAIDNLSELYEKEDAAFRPTAIHKFIVNSIERWINDAKPHDRYKNNCKATEKKYTKADYSAGFEGQVL